MRRSSRRTPTGWADLRDSLDSLALDDLVAGGRARSVDDMRRFARMYARPKRDRAGLVDGHHPARLRHGQRAGDRQPGARARERRPAGRGPDADPRPLRRPGRRGDGLPTRPSSRAACRSPSESAADLAAAVRLPDPPRARPLRGRDGRGRGARRDRRAVVVSGGNFLDTLPDPAAVRGRAGTRAAPRPLRTSWSARRCSSIRARRCCSCPAMTRYEQPGGGTETTTERRVAFRPEIPRSARRRGARRVADLPRPGARASIPSGRGAHRLRERPRPSATRSPASCRSTTASSTWRRPATRSSGAASDSATVGASRRPTARRTSASVTPREVGPRATAASCSRPAAASSSTRWSASSATRSPAPTATPCSWPMRTLRALGLRDGDAGASCAPTTGEVQARIRRGRSSAAATSRCSSPRRTRSSRPGRLDPVGARPRLQRRRRGRPRRNSLTAQPTRA